MKCLRCRRALWLACLVMPACFLFQACLVGSNPLRVAPGSQRDSLLSDSTRIASPPLLCQFEVSDSAGTLRFHWETDSLSSALAWRLVGVTNDREWVLPCVAKSTRDFAAVDLSRRLGRPGSATYSLYASGADSVWRLVHREIVKRDSLTTTPGSLAFHPYPLIKSGLLRFTLDRSQWIQLSAHDVAGRRVALLARGWHPPGSNLLRWSGRNERGEKLPAGVYLIRLCSESRTESKKLVYLR